MKTPTKEDDWNLSSKIDYVKKGWETASDGELLDVKDVKEFVRRLKEVAENNDWEVAIDDRKI